MEEITYGVKAETVAVALILAALVSLGDCAGRSSTAASASNFPGRDSGMTRPLQTATYAGPILTPTTVAAADVTLDVPVARPKISWQQAYATCESREALCDSKAAAVISLAAATSPNAGAMSNTDSSIAPLMKRTLSM